MCASVLWKLLTDGFFQLKKLIGRPGLSPCPLHVQRFITSTPKYASQASLQASLPAIDSFPASFLYLLTTASTVSKLSFTISELERRNGGCFVQGVDAWVGFAFGLSMLMFVSIVKGFRDGVFTSRLSVALSVSVQEVEVGIFK